MELVGGFATTIGHKEKIL